MTRSGQWAASQSWSMMTPGRRGISPLPGDLFYSQDIDVNYHLGPNLSAAANALVCADSRPVPIMASQPAESLLF